MKRPSQQPQRPLQTDAELQVLAERALYVGSSEHKAQRWWGGLPEAFVGKDGKAKRPKKQKTTICPLVENADQQRATEWVQRAIVNRQFKFVEGDKDFPRYVWYDEGGQFWFGRCVNSTAGQYKGWPVDEEEYRAILD